MVAVGVMVMVVVEVAGLLQEELDSPEMEMEDGLAVVVSLNPLLMVEPDKVYMAVPVVEVWVPLEEVLLVTAAAAAAAVNPVVVVVVVVVAQAQAAAAVVVPTIMVLVRITLQALETATVR